MSGRTLASAFCLAAIICAPVAGVAETCAQHPQMSSQDANARWQQVVAEADPAAMERLAGSWANQMTADIGGVLSEASISEVLDQGGDFTKETSICPLAGGDCDVRLSSGIWAARATSGGVIELARMEIVGERAGMCSFVEITLNGDDLMLFAGSGGELMRRVR